MSFDPRGVGESDPVVCASPAALRRWIALDPDPGTPAAVSSLIVAVKAFDRSCRMPSDVLASLSTAVTARDMDRLRVALGRSKLDYLGFSYGTYLGALYAQAFPSHVGNMALDGAIDPALGAAPLEIEQANSFEVDLHDFFAWCPTNATCHQELPAGAAVTYGNVIDRLKGGGTLTADLSSALGGVQQATYGVALTGVISSLYTTTDWPYLAEGLAQAASGNGTVLTELAYEYAGFNANGTAANLISANLAVSCLDRPSPPVAGLSALARRSLCPSSSSAPPTTRRRRMFGRKHSRASSPDRGCSRAPVTATRVTSRARVSRAGWTTTCSAVIDPRWARSARATPERTDR